VEQDDRARDQLGQSGLTRLGQPSVSKFETEEHSRDDSAELDLRSYLASQHLSIVVEGNRVTVVGSFVCRGSACGPGARATLDRLSEAPTSSEMPGLDCGRDKLAEAQTAIDIAVNMAETWFTSTNGQQASGPFSATAGSAFEMGIRLQMQLLRLEPWAGHEVKALQLSEAAHARILAEVLKQPAVGTANGARPQVPELERALQNELDPERDGCPKQAEGEKAGDHLIADRVELGTIRSIDIDVQNRITPPNALYAALMQPQALDLRRIQDLLDRNTLLLEYSLGDERSYLWAVTDSEMKAYPLPGRTEVETAARAVYDLLADSEGAGRSASAWSANYAKAAARSSQILLGPVASQLGNKRLLVVPEGALQFIPFSALPEPMSLRNRGTTRVPMVVKHEVIDLPSAGALAALRNEIERRKPAEKAIAVLANPVFDKDDYRVKAPKTAIASSDKQTTVAVPESTERAKDLSDLRRALRGVTLSVDESHLPPLPSSKDEADAISKLVPDQQALIATDFKANRPMATGPELSQYRIVHFATHALLNTEHPELSGIVLSMVDEKGQPQNGFLSLGDIYNLKLPAELVVLSACNTALGRDIKGEGLIGLTRGFMYAGAARVISSLWKVDDEASSELMRRFYQKMLKEGERPAAALRFAQVEMLNTRRWSSPRHWAGFILQGEWK
jgi:CHAT domain-containing protein